MNIASLLSFSVFSKLKTLERSLFFANFLTLCFRFLSIFILPLPKKLPELLIQQTKVFCLFCLLFSPLAQAVKISFPDEELSSESVLPVVDNPALVLNRSVSLKRRVEINTSFGVGLDEPFYFPFYAMGQLAFHLTENHSLNLLGIYYPPLLSSTGKRLKEGAGLSNNQTFSADKAPYPQMSVFLNYHYSPFYGKISLSKILNLNLSIYGFTGLGLVVSNQNDRFPAANVGFGQKLYITRWIGLRGDIAFYGYYGPALTKLDLGSSVQSVKYSSLGAGQKRVNLNVLASFGVIFLL